MRLLFIRHAIAEDRDEWAKSGRPDAERPLTDRGRDRMRRAARGLARLLPRPDLIATSPYLRAAETAAIVSKGLWWAAAGGARARWFPAWTSPTWSPGFGG